MAKIFYSLCGEGRGHATRVQAMVELLRPRHEVVVFASGQAMSLLQPIFKGTDVRLEHIPGLSLHYSRFDRRLRYLKTGFHWGKYLTTMGELVDRFVQKIEEEKPDIAITDLEPVLPRAALKTGLPFLCFDHQHFLVVNDLSELPLELRLHAFLLGSAVQWFASGQLDTIVSSFYAAPLRPGYEHVTQVGVLLRPEVLALRPERGPHVLTYLRRFGAPRILEALRACGRPVRVYGLGHQPKSDNLVFCPTDTRSFVRDLAHCQALVCTAGNQLVGEALYLGKPVLALPENGNFEQAVNGYFLKKCGGGDSLPLEACGPAALLAFLETADIYRQAVAPTAVNGNRDAVAAVERHLHAPDAVSRPVPSAAPWSLPQNWIRELTASGSR